MTSDPLAYHLDDAARADILAAYRDDSACSGKGLLMDPPGGHTPETERAAVAVCRRCPIHDQCQAQVLELPGDADPGGVLGGLTEQRRKQRRRRARWEANRNRPVTEGKKVCRTCGDPKPLTEYYDAACTGDRLDTRCKDCCRQVARDRRAARKDRERS